MSLIFVTEASLALLVSVGLYCLYKWALARRHLFLRAFADMRRGTVAVLLAFAVVATIEAQKSGGENGELRMENGELPQPSALDTSSILHSSFSILHSNLCFTGISVSSNNVALSLAWPTNHLFAGDIVDLFAATSLVGAAWNWVAAHGVASNTETNWTEIVDTAAIAGTPNPSMMFFSASLRSDPGDLRDTDGDTIPDAYEVHNGTNPYVPDYALAPKLTVGPSGMHADISSALAASEAYDIVELDPTAVHDVGGLGASVPAHPVMVCSPPGTRAVVKATGMSAFLLDAASSSRTLFRNLYILLDAQSGYQAGFWVGGSLPWSGTGAAATFEDVHVRMPHPGVLCYGWHFYRGASETAILSRCQVNAAGSDCAYGVYSYGSQSLVLDRCSFVNFPPNGENVSCGVLLQTSLSAGGGVEVSVSRCLFDESFTNAVMFGRLENGESNLLSVVDCLIPRELPSLYHPDSVSGLVVANAALTWSGFPWPDSPSVALGMGALMPFANDPTADTDGDGFCDYVEVYEKGTDPYLVDSDMDGISDYDEDQQGTDPANPHSFLQNLTVAVTNSAASFSTYVAWGYSEVGWETNGLAMFQSSFGTVVYTNAAAQGATHIKAFCDLDGDGEYSDGTDILMIQTIPLQSMATCIFNFASVDSDGDSVSDIQELTMDHTDPYDAGNVRINLTYKYTDRDAWNGCTNLIAISETSNGWNAAEIVAASIQEHSQAIPVDRTVTDGIIYVKCLHDRNGNRELDPETEKVYVTALRALQNGKTVTAYIGDADDDGVNDTQELADGTDIFNADNYRLKTRIDISNADWNGPFTNYVTVSQQSDDWQPDNVVTAFVNYATMVELDMELTNGVAYLRCLRDLDADGDYTAANDLLHRMTLTAKSSYSQASLRIGDYDGDNIPDSREMSEGTNLKGGTNYCFSLNATVAGIFVPSNRLTAIAYVGSEANVLYGPHVQTGATLTVDFGHLATASREAVSFLFWDDENLNGACDEGERKTVSSFPVIGHDMCVTNFLGLGDFDADGDGMLDAWERANGLDPSNAADAKGDADGDGFMNLHEYWAGTDPHDATDDGSGTALHVATHAVDDRIADKTGNVVAARPIYENYVLDVFETNLVRNAGCWVADIDLTCTSVRNLDMSYHYGDSATLITPQHVVLAAHLNSPIGRQYVFRATNGTTTVRRLIGRAWIGGTDIMVGMLESPLPSEYVPAKLLPPDYGRWIGSGRLIPVLHLNKMRWAFVHELPDLPTWANRSEIYCNRGSSSTRFAFYYGLYGNDSGNPCFMLLGDERILLYAVHAHRNGVGEHLESVGPHTTLYATELKAAIDSLSDAVGETRRSLSFFDFSLFPIVGGGVP